jgi:hypothetical protein
MEAPEAVIEAAEHGARTVARASNATRLNASCGKAPGQPAASVVLPAKEAASAVGRRRTYKNHKPTALLASTSP